MGPGKPWHSHLDIVVDLVHHLTINVGESAALLTLYLIKRCFCGELFEVLVGFDVAEEHRIHVHGLLHEG